MSVFKTNIFVKLGLIFILLLVLLLPTVWVKSLITERESIQQQAIREVGSKWGSGQTITGPFISIPYDRYLKTFSKKDSIYKLTKHKEWLHFLPEKLNVKGTIKPEKRYRGIYEIVVYESMLKLEGNFTNISPKGFDINPKDIHFDKAMLNVGISDLKGIEKQMQLKWDGQAISFNSGTTTNHIASSGVNATVPVKQSENLTNYKFDIEIELKGSQYLYFTPLGKNTDINLSSPWQTPSFTGTYLPDEREVSEAGFSAHWNILHLNRNYPQQWTNSDYDIRRSSFGTDLLLPVDNYKKSDRVIKYALLFLVLTFLTFFFVEIMQKVFIHPIQYLLVGVALIVFYTLLLSFSEHIVFNLAYIVASLLTLLLISLYITAILKSRQIGGLILGILSILYTFIFVIIQLEDYALLIGSVGMFLILAIVMYFSRKIDWYNVHLGNTENKK